LHTFEGKKNLGHAKLITGSQALFCQN